MLSVALTDIVTNKTTHLQILYPTHLFLMRSNRDCLHSPLQLGISRTMLMLSQPNGLKHIFVRLKFACSCRKRKGYNLFIVPSHFSEQFSKVIIVSLNRKNNNTHTHSLFSHRSEKQPNCTCWLHVENCGCSASDIKCFFSFSFIQSIL